MIALVALLWALPPGTLVDRIVAVVDKQVITQSELLTEARVALALRAGEAAASAELDEPLVASLLDYVVNQHLVAHEARRLGSVEVSEAEVSLALARFAQLFRTNDAYRAFLRRYELSEDEVRNILLRNLRNDRYIADRMRLRLADTEGKQQGSPRYDEALKRWIAELRAGVEIRKLGAHGTLELVREVSEAVAVEPPGAAEAP